MKYVMSILKKIIKLKPSRMRRNVLIKGDNMYRKMIDEQKILKIDMARDALITDYDISV